MNPQHYMIKHTKGKTLLALCAGIGNQLANLGATEITAVDIAEPYIAELKKRFPHVHAVKSDAVEFLKKQKDNSFEVVTMIDGLEHLPKKQGLEALEEMKRVAKEKVLVFTQEGYLRNEPHNAWGIEGCDEYQTHKSAWLIPELADLGYGLLAEASMISQHGEPYKAIMVLHSCSQ